jgi:hypothetical protein
VVEEGTERWKIMDKEMSQRRREKRKKEEEE